MKLILFFTLSICLLSCSPHKEKDNNIPIILCELKENTGMNFSDYFKSIEITPLETTQECLIETVGKIIEHNGYYYIGSASSETEKIFIFNKNGKYLYKLDQRGMGPDEYINIRDFDVISDFNVALICRSNASLYVYDLSKDSCIFRKNLDIYPNNIVCDNGDFYIMKDGTKYQRNENYLVYKYNAKGEMIDHYYEANETIQKITSCILPFKTLSTSQDGLYFTFPCSDKVYKLTNNQFIADFIIDTKDKSIPIERFKNINGLLDMEAIIRREKGVNDMLYYSLGYPISVFTFMDYKNDGYITLYNHETNQSKTATYWIDDLLFKGNRMDLKAWKLPKLYENGILYYIAEPTELIEAMSDYKDRISSDEWNIFCNKHPDIVEKIHQMKADDNPVLVKLILKS